MTVDRRTEDGQTQDDLGEGPAVGEVRVARVTPEIINKSQIPLTD